MKQIFDFREENLDGFNRLINNNTKKVVAGGYEHIFPYHLNNNSFYHFAFYETYMDLYKNGEQIGFHIHNSKSSDGKLKKIKFEEPQQYNCNGFYCFLFETETNDCFLVYNDNPENTNFRFLWFDKTKKVIVGFDRYPREGFNEYNNTFLIASKTPLFRDEDGKWVHLEYPLFYDVLGKINGFVIPTFNMTMDKYVYDLDEKRFYLLDNNFVLDPSKRTQTVDTMEKTILFNEDVLPNIKKLCPDLNGVVFKFEEIEQEYGDFFMGISVSVPANGFDVKLIFNFKQ